MIIFKFIFNVILLVVLTSFSLHSCTTITMKDRELIPYANKFIFDMDLDESDLSRITLKFSSLGNVAGDEFVKLGVCNYLTGIVEIDPGQWYRGGENRTRKKALIYHELGHCICFEDHDDRVMNDSCPVSMMNSQLVPTNCLWKHWDHYIKELRGKCK